jgi:hypothetical protein
MHTLSRTLLTFILLPSLFILATAQSSAGQNTKTIDEKWYSFKIPANWAEVPPDFEAALLKSVDSQSKAIFQEYYGKHSEAVPGRIVHNFKGYFSPGRKILFSAWTMTIPKKMTDYPQVIYKHSKQVIEWGKSNGKVKDVLKNKIQIIDGMSVHHSDLMMGNGHRMIGVGYYHPDTPGVIVTLNIIVTTGTLTGQQDKQLEDAIESVKAKLK